MKYVAYTDFSKRTWLVGLDDHKSSYRAESNIWVSSTPSNRGLGGRNMEFLLKSGGTITLQGPWHSNSSSFEANVGIPLRVFNA